MHCCDDDDRFDHVIINSSFSNHVIHPPAIMLFILWKSCCSSSWSHVVHPLHRHFMDQLVSSLRHTSQLIHRHLHHSLTHSLTNSLWLWTFCFWSSKSNPSDQSCSKGEDSNTRSGSLLKTWSDTHRKNFSSVVPDHLYSCTCKIQMQAFLLREKPTSLDTKTHPTHPPSCARHLSWMNF